MSEAADSTRLRVRVWFGNEMICAHTAQPVRAHRYAALMSQRFAGLRVTIDDDPSGSSAKPLPTEPLWPLTAK